MLTSPNKTLMLYFDESGYTGADLTNSSQPFFTLASIRISNDEIECLKKDIKHENFGKELHFSRMYSNHNGRQMLNSIFNHPLMDSNHVLLSFAHKNFCIYANIVNILIETLYHNNGINLYEGAKNLILANGLYYFAKSHPNKNLVFDFEKNFVQMVRNPSTNSIAEFYRLTDELIFDKHTKDDFVTLLIEIPPTIRCIREALSDQKFYMDLTVPLFSVSVQKWYKKTSIKEDVLFDSSEPFYANKEFLETLRDMDVPETEVGYGSNKHVYPLPIGSLGAKKSHEEFGLQLADIYASALNFILTPRNDKFVKYQNTLKPLPLFQDLELNIAPATNAFIEKRTKETADIDPLEFLCNPKAFTKNRHKK